MRRGYHRKPLETKKAIVGYLLHTSDGKAEEPVLRDFLKTELDITESKNIKNHLSELKKDGCITKSENKGYANIWTVDASDNIRQICEVFGLSMVQKSDFALRLIAEVFFDMEKMNDPEFRKIHNMIFGDLLDKFNFMLKFSPTFFNFAIRCKYSDDIFEAAERLFLSDTGFGFSPNAHLLIDESLPDYEWRKKLMELLHNKMVNPRIFAVDDLIKHCLKHDIFSNCATHEGIEYLKEIKISEGKIKKEMNKIEEKN